PAPGRRKRPRRSSTAGSWEGLLVSIGTQCGRAALFPSGSTLDAHGQAATIPAPTRVDRGRRHYSHRPQSIAAPPPSLAAAAAVAARAVRGGHGRAGGGTALRRTADVGLHAGAPGRGLAPGRPGLPRGLRLARPGEHRPRAAVVGDRGRGPELRLPPRL